MKQEEIGKKTILDLLIDDDPAVRRMAREMAMRLLEASEEK